MPLKIRKAMLPIYIMSKLILHSPFTLGTEKIKPSSSYIGSIYSICGIVIYVTFHIYSANQITELVASADIVSKDYGLVSILIDLYNRYSGVVLFAINIFVGVCQQKKIVTFITRVESIDSDFENHLGISNVDNLEWMRWILYKNFGFEKLLFFIFRNATGRFIFLLGLCTAIEYSNCLMYIRDIFPYTGNCIFMCLLPMTINSATEILFIAYMNIMRTRLAKLNKLIRKLKSEYGNNGLSHDEKIFYISEMLIEKRGQNKNQVYPKSMNIMEDDVLMRISTVQKIFNQIYECLELIDKAFGIQLVFLLMQQFVMMTTILFYCISNLIKYRWNFNLLKNS